MSTITETSLRVFLAAARDAGNWSGEPMFQGSKEDRGNLTQLKRAKLIDTFTDRGDTFIRFTTAGIALAATHGVTITC
jgi:hypothetical protein